MNSYNCACNLSNGWVGFVVLEIAATKPPFADEDSVSVATVLENYDAAKHTPVFYGNVMHKRMSVDQAPEADFDAAKSHPSCVGFAFVPRPPPEKASSPPPPPDVRASKQIHHVHVHCYSPSVHAILSQANSKSRYGDSAFAAPPPVNCLPVICPIIASPIKCPQVKHILILVKRGHTTWVANNGAVDQWAVKWGCPVISRYIYKRFQNSQSQID